VINEQLGMLPSRAFADVPLSLGSNLNGGTCFDAKVSESRSSDPSLGGISFIQHVLHLSVLHTTANVGLQPLTPS
jgi:hypothetical protein